MLAEVEADRPGNRMNDGACDGAGRFWAGTMAIDERPGAGALYRLDPDLTVHTMLTGVSISNGIDWSLDDRRMYYVDSPTRRIDVFDFDVAAGAIANRRTFVELPADAGLSGRADRGRGRLRLGRPLGRRRPCAATPRTGRWSAWCRFR